MKLRGLTVEGLTRYTHPITVDFDAIGPGVIAITGPNGCLSGDTLIDVPRDLTRHPQGVPLRDLVGTTPVVYACDTATGRLVLAHARDVRLTHKDAPVVRVRYTARANSRFLPPCELVGTADHPVLLRDGTYKPLGALVPGDRLMPMYRRVRDGKYAWLDMNDGSFALEHRVVAAFGAGRDLATNEHAHHEDHNSLNNDPANVTAMPAADHLALHGRARPPHYDDHPRGMAGKRQSPESRGQIAATMRTAWADPAHRDQHTAAIRAGAKAREVEPYKQAATLRKLYLDDGLGTVAIGAKYGVSDTCIGYWLRKHGIPRRPAGFQGHGNHVVLSVEPAGRQDVYDMEVPGHANFVANGVVVHNSGKTTLIECTAPAVLYRELPTREPGAIQNWTAAAGGRVALDFDLGCRQYSATLSVDAKGQQTATLRRDGKAITSGKVRDYDAAIQSLVGSKDAFYASVFGAQGGKGRFAALGVAARKAVFRYYLGLDRIERLHAAAKLRLAGCEPPAAVAAAERDVTACEAELTAAKALQVKSKADVAAARTAADRTGARLVDLTAQAAMVDLLDAYDQAVDDFLRMDDQVRALEGAPFEESDPAEGEAREAGVAEAQDALDAQVALHTRVDRLGDAVAAADKSVRQRQTALDDLQRRAALVARVPCKGEGPYAGCELLADAVACAGQVGDARDLLAESKTQLQDLTARRDEAKDALVPLDDLRDDLRDAQGSLRRWTDHKLAATRWADALAAKRTERDGAKARAKDLKGRLPDPIPDDVPTADDLDTARRDDRVAKRDLEAAVSAVASAEAAVTWATDNAARAKDLLAVKRKAVDDRQPLDLLVRALGPDGVQAYEIDAAGPRVSALANDLLAACYGPRFSLEVSTTRTLKGGGTAEDFAILVHDGLRGRSGEIESLSGGEQVVVDEALRTALALFATERHGLQIATLWRDECVGGLDDDNAGRYVRMLHRARELGGFHQVLFVTHDRAAADTADAVIQVGADGAVTVG